MTGRKEGAMNRGDGTFSRLLCGGGSDTRKWVYAIGGGMDGSLRASGGGGDTRVLVALGAGADGT